MSLTLALMLTAMQDAPAAPPPAPVETPAPTLTPDPALATIGGPRRFGPLEQARFDQCHDTAVDDPAAGVAAANVWLVEGGGFLARQCLGFAYARGGNYAGAATTFAQAAGEAETARDWRAANLWAQAGNAALAAGDAATARSHLNTALVQGRLSGLQLGEAYLDRARAALVLEDWAAARADLDLAAQTAADDPLVWLLSATLARRQGDLARAQTDIDIAARIGPRDAAIALEAGNIAAAADRLDVARRSWDSAVTLGGTSPAAATARARLTELDAYEAEVAANPLPEPPAATPAAAAAAPPQP